MSASAESPEGVTFLTALLVRYPEIGSARLDTETSTLHLDFYLQQQLDETEFEAFLQNLDLSWDVFFDLQQLEPRVRRVARSEARRGEFISVDPDADAEVDSLQVIRDLFTLSSEELSLLVELVRQAFSSELALDEELPEDEAGFQEEVLHRSLERLRSHPGSPVSLSGFRDEMRVLIYASSEDEPLK